MTKTKREEGLASSSDLPVIIHTNVCGPFLIVTHNVLRYFILFVDDFSRDAYVFLIADKSVYLLFLSSINRS